MVVEGAKVWTTAEEAILELPGLREGGSGPVLSGPVMGGPTMQGALQPGVTEWNLEILWEGPFTGTEQLCMFTFLLEPAFNFIYEGTCFAQLKRWRHYSSSTATIRRWRPEVWYDL